jgi:SAM-dependent methyltransferase
MNFPSCRFCRAPLTVTFADLGMSPISNDFIPAEQAGAMEPFYPLHARVCSQCFLVQLDDITRSESMFSNNYAYFSSYSDTWLAHARDYAAKMIAAERLGSDSLVVEIASNDGYLLQYFKSAEVPVLGVEPTANTARVAFENHGIVSENAFFGHMAALALRERGIRADLIAANNVLAHVPDINDFVSGYPIILKPSGVATVEFPHLLNLIEQGQFDTIYHEHYSYLSCGTVSRIFATHGMRVYHVEELSTHGGSLRLFICHDEADRRPSSPTVAAMLERERAAGLCEEKTYRRFGETIVQVKCDLLAFLIEARREGKTVVGYGAPAKGNTLLNYCGIKPDLVRFTVDRSPHKVGRMLPGSRIPILPVDAIREARPDYVLILPWNLRQEIMAQMADIAAWGGRFVTAIPTLQLY